MSLKVKKVNLRLKEYPQVMNLMHKAFPKEELLSDWLLWLLALHRDVRFLAFYEEEEFCGLAYAFFSRQYVFITYLAVENAFRSSGYGSRILSMFKKAAKGRELVLTVEDPQKGTDNYEQRVRRIGFYERNGFYKTGYVLEEMGFDNLVLSTDSAFSPEKFCEMFGRYGMNRLRRHEETKEPDHSSI